MATRQVVVDIVPAAGGGQQVADAGFTYRILKSNCSIPNVPSDDLGGLRGVIDEPEFTEAVNVGPSALSLQIDHNPTELTFGNIIRVNYPDGSVAGYWRHEGLVSKVADSDTTFDLTLTPIVGEAGDCDFTGNYTNDATQPGVVLGPQTFDIPVTTALARTQHLKAGTIANNGTPYGYSYNNARVTDTLSQAVTFGGASWFWRCSTQGVVDLSNQPFYAHKMTVDREVIAGEWDENITALCNIQPVVGGQPAGSTTNLTAVAVDTNPSNPYSVPNLGRRCAQVYNDSSLLDQNAVNAVATALLGFAERVQRDRTVTVQGYDIRRPRPGDTLTLRAPTPDWTEANPNNDPDAVIGPFLITKVTEHGATKTYDITFQADNVVQPGQIDPMYAVNAYIAAQMRNPSTTGVSPDGSTGTIQPTATVGGSTAAPSAPAIAIAAVGTGQQFGVAYTDGYVHVYGGATWYGSEGGQSLKGAIVGLAMRPQGDGYWLCGSDGGVFAFGSATFYGSMGGITLAAPVVEMTVTSTGLGYWLVAADGGVFAFGDAVYHGSASATHKAAPIVGMERTSTNGGYWLVGADGAVYAFGDASSSIGSLVGIHLAAPIVGCSRPHSSTTGGLWLVGADGGVFALGDAVYYNRANPTTNSVVGIVTTSTGAGYWVLDDTGTITPLGDAGAPTAGTGNVAHPAPPPPPPKPGSPVGLYAITGIDNIAQTNNAFAILTWSANAFSDAPTAYQVQWRKAGDSQYYTLGSTVTNVKVPGLIQGQTYSFSVQCQNLSGQWGPWSAETSFTTPVDASAPAKPTGLVAYRSPRGAFVQWTGNSEADLQGYVLQVSIGGGPFAPVNTAPMLATSNYYVAPSGTPQQTVLVFQLAAVDWSGNQSPWATATADTPTDGVYFDEVMTGNLTAVGTITGGRLQTGSSGARAVMDSTGVTLYDGTLTDHGAGAGITARLKSTDGTAFFSGTIQGSKILPVSQAGPYMSLDLTGTTPNAVVNDGTRTRTQMGYLPDGTYGLRAWDSSGNAIFDTAGLIQVMSLAASYGPSGVATLTAAGSGQTILGPLAITMPRAGNSILVMATGTFSDQSGGTVALTGDDTVYLGCNGQFSQKLSIMSNALGGGDHIQHCWTIFGVFTNIPTSGAGVTIYADVNESNGGTLAVKYGSMSIYAFRLGS